MSRFVRHWPFALFMLGAFPCLWPAIRGTLGTMTDASQHMEFVWLVPLLALAVLWSRRAAIARSLGAPAPLLALPLVALGAIFLFFGLRGDQTRFLQAGAVCLLLAAPLACYGWRAFKVTWFPILLLAFVMPVGFLDNFTVPLRRASVAVGTVLLNGLGVEVRQVGTAIVSTGVPPFQLDVADPCSGIRSLVALFVGTAAYGAFALRGVWRRWALFLASVPIAFFGNVLRLLLTAITCKWMGQSAGMTLHDNALFIVAPIYILCVFWLTDWLRRGETEDAPAEAAPVEPPLGPGATPWRWRVAAVGAMALLLPCFYLWARQTPPLEYERDVFLNKTFAHLPGATTSYPWFCQDRTCLWSRDFAEADPPPATCPRCGGEVRRVSRAELDILPADTYSRKVTYTMGNGDVFTIALVIAGRNRMSIHRPELCLPAQGFSMSERHIKPILPGLPMACFSLSREGQTGTSGFAYVFLNSREATCSNLRRVVGDSVERSLYNRIQRWAMVTVSCPRQDFLTPEGETALRNFMAQWWPTLWASGEPPHD